MTDQFGFSFDISRCSGCMACVVACMDQNDLPSEGPSFRQVIQMETGAHPSAEIRFVSMACFHCNDAPCLQVCPRKAISRDRESGVIQVDEARCIGCRTCAMVCPFGAPQFPGSAAMKKCNRCAERVALDMEPACVRTCPTKALGFGTMEKLSWQNASKAGILILESVLSKSV